MKEENIASSLSKRSSEFADSESSTDNENLKDSQIFYSNESSDNKNSRNASSLLSSNEEIPDKSVIISSETAKELEEDSGVENIKKVEAALFISARFLNLQELVMLTDVNPLMIKEILEKLIERYNKEDSAIEIVVKDNMWKMDVRQEYVSMINKLATGSAEFSKAEQETLAVIAYKQPVKQSVIVNIRGNKSYEHIKHFIDIGLVQAKRAGHTLELKLSDDFFEYFHLQKKEEGGRIVAVEEKNIEENEEEDDKASSDNDESEDIASSDNDKSEDIASSDNDKSEDIASSDNDKSEDSEVVGENSNGNNSIN